MMHTRRSLRTIGVLARFVFVTGLVSFLWGAPLTDVSAADKLTVYSGRAERLIKPVLDAFTAKTGIQIDLLSSGTTELVNRMKAEGDRSPADVFITNDAGSLEIARTAGLLRPLSMREVERAIPSQFRAADNSWIGLSGRFWIIVYNTNLMNPDQIKSVVRASLGDDVTKTFLEGLRDNAGTQVYQKSSQIVEAVAKGQVALGIVNHYYVYRHLATQPTAPLGVLMPDQQDGGMGAIMNVAGIGILKHTPRIDNAKLLVEFLVAQAGQKMFADLDKEYPLHPEVKGDPALPDRKSFRAALVPLSKLAELREPTMLLIEQVGMR
jgi:iron(III) transport system substrate-binding protein